MELILPSDKRLHFYGKIYKFISVKSALKLLQSSKLKFSNPTLFNDPLDCSKFLFDFNISDDLLTTKPINSNLKDSIKHLLNERYNLELSDLYEVVYDLKKIKNGELTEMKISSLKRMYQEIFSKEEIEKYRLCCFSKNYCGQKSFLMWTHYADSHKGLCLEFDNRIFLHSEYSNLFLPTNIKYESKFPEIKTKSDFDSNEWLWTKLKRFSYEKEVRIIFKNNKIESCNYISFPKNFLTKIIFGVNTSKEDIKKINEVIDKRFNLQSLKFEKMWIDPNNLRLVKHRFDIKNQFLYR